jgi:hypothetical protein
VCFLPLAKGLLAIDETLRWQVQKGFYFLIYLYFKMVRLWIDFTSVFVISHIFQIKSRIWNWVWVADKSPCPHPTQQGSGFGSGFDSGVKPCFTFSTLPKKMCVRAGGNGSQVKHLPRMCEALGLIPSTIKTKTKTKNICMLAPRMRIIIAMFRLLWRVKWSRIKYVWHQ